jgi:hypothetical protein
MKKFCMVILLILTTQAFFSISLFAQEKEKGKLADFEKEVEKDSDKNDENEDNSSGFFINGSPGDIFNVFIITEDEIRTGTWYSGYSNYPYSENSIGTYLWNSKKKYSVTGEANYFFHSNNLTGINFNSRLSPYPLISFDIKFSDLKEKLNTRYDHLKIYGLFINYNRLKNEHIAFWWGLGFKGILGDETNSGFAVNSGVDIFPASPISLSANLNLGFINSANVYDFSAKIKYHFDRMYCSLGYQKYTAGQVSIGGWILGFGFYL